MSLDESRKREEPLLLVARLLRDDPRLRSLCDGQGRRVFGHAAIVTVLMLASRVNRKKGKAWPSFRRRAADSWMDERSVRRSRQATEIFFERDDAGDYRPRDRDEVEARIALETARTARNQTRIEPSRRDAPVTPVTDIASESTDCASAGPASTSATPGHSVRSERTVCPSKKKENYSSEVETEEVQERLTRDRVSTLFPSETGTVRRRRANSLSTPSPLSSLEGSAPSIDIAQRLELLRKQALDLRGEGN